jgi:hypothetical protein
MSEQEVAEYLKHAEHNAKFVDFLISDVLPKRANFSDWAMVALFYAALHYTKAAILHKHRCIAEQHKGYPDEATGRYTPGHEDYVRWFMGPSTTALYTDLFQMAWDARYEDFYLLPDASLAEVKRQRANLAKIEQHSATMLAEPPADLRP